MTDVTEPRRLPAPPMARDRCRDCRQPIVWAITVASPTGSGGKNQAFNPIEDPAGRVAITNPHRGQLRARALTADETYDPRIGEYLGMPHAATCTARMTETDVAPVVDLASRRRYRPRGSR